MDDKPQSQRIGTCHYSNSHETDKSSSETICKLTRGKKMGLCFFIKKKAKMATKEVIVKLDKSLDTLTKYSLTLMLVK